MFSLMLLCCSVSLFSWSSDSRLLTNIPAVDFQSLSFSHLSRGLLDFLSFYLLYVDYEIPEVTAVELERLLRNWPANKSTGYGGLTNILLRILPQVAVEFIRDFFNIWKTPTNYRPISLLPMLSKVFGKLLLVRLYVHGTHGKTWINSFVSVWFQGTTLNDVADSEGRLLCTVGSRLGATWCSTPSGNRALCSNWRALSCQTVTCRCVPSQ